MALKILQPGIQPLGQFDLLDAYNTVSGIAGGEVGSFVQASLSGTDVAASDALDGYASTSALTRPAVMVGVYGNDETSLPLFLLDEGTTGYGTLFGQVVGTTAGRSTTGTALGPVTSAGSGKVTCWDKPGLYSVDVDNVSSDLCSSSSCSATVRTALGVQDDTGLLTLANAADAVDASGTDLVVGRFIEVTTQGGGSLVTTPRSLLTATDSLAEVVFHFQVETF